jgi:hypothetical protein
VAGAEFRTSYARRARRCISSYASHRRASVIFV